MLRLLKSCPWVSKLLLDLIVLCIKSLVRSVFLRQQCITSFVRTWNCSALERGVFRNWLKLTRRNWTHLQFSTQCSNGCQCVLFNFQWFLFSTMSATVLYLGGRFFRDTMYNKYTHVPFTYYICVGLQWKVGGHTTLQTLKFDFKYFDMFRSWQSCGLV